MRKILLIDDDPQMVTLLTTLLEIEGFRVDSSDGSGSVNAQIQESRPDLILLDVHLNEASGLDIVQTIRRDPDFATTTVVMSSGMDLAPECLEAGADYFLLKPYMPDDLLHIFRED
jgi:DNA-binding response OmpR family regulator